MNKELQINGRKIFYRIHGQGKPVILVHGFGETGDVWQHQVDFLEKDFQLIVPDLPGSGQSEMIEDMSMEGMAEIIKTILDKECGPLQTSPPVGGGGLANTQGQPDENSIRKENIKSSESSQVPPPAGGGFRGVGAGVTLIGHSMGGYITLAFAEKYPAYVRSFGLFHSTAYADTEEKKATRQKGIEFVRQHGAFEFLKTSSLNLFSPVTKQQNPALTEEFIRSLHNFSAEAIVSYYEAMMRRPDRTHVLKTTRLPVLFVIGDYDNAVPARDSLEQSHLPEISYIHLLHQSGHMGMIEEPNKSNELLKKFLSET